MTVAFICDIQFSNYFKMYDSWNNYQNNFQTVFDKFSVAFIFYWKKNSFFLFSGFVVKSTDIGKQISTICLRWWLFYLFITAKR